MGDWKNGRRAARAWTCLCALTLLAASGCTTLQPVEGQAAAERLEPGDTVLVTTEDGGRLELSLADWTAEALTGRDETGILHKVENDDIAEVQVKRTSVARSVGLGVAAVGVLAGIAVAIADDMGLTDY